MDNAQIVEQLGLSYKSLAPGVEVMSAPVQFHVYNPAFLTSPEGVPEYLLTAKAEDDGQYRVQFQVWTDSGSFVAELSKLVVLTEAEAAQFKRLFDKSAELHERNQTTGRVYDDLLDEFDALKGAFESRASLFEPA